MKSKIFIMILTLTCFAFIGDVVNDFYTPDHFPEPTYNFTNNPITAEKIELGRALFFDVNLSRDSSTSCASCHSPYNAFAHTDHDLSHGLDDQIGRRNAPALFNLAWHSDFMWDGAINHLDVQALAPISHAKEMGTDIATVIDYLNGRKLYSKLFLEAFNDSIANSQNILKALSSFQLTLISAQSKYDLVLKGDTTFSVKEEKGYTLFKSNCNGCHTEPLFSNYQFRNNGLPLDSTLMDFGRGEITGMTQDSSKFKVPSLRNLSYSFPYMHDGRFNKLREVLNHYSLSHKVGNATMDTSITSIALSSKDKSEMISFLLTLNDEKFIFNPQNKFPRRILLPSSLND